MENDAKVLPERAVRSGISLPLAISLGVNLLLIGLFAGLLFQLRDSQNASEQAQDVQRPIPGALLRHLPPEEKAELRERGRDLARDIRSHRRERRRLMDGVLEALAAEPYDPAAAERAIEALHDAEGVSRAEGQTTFLEFWNGLDGEVRQRVVEDWKAERRRQRSHEGPPAAR
jgi:uncharacterized membrane protein